MSRYKVSNITGLPGVQIYDKLVLYPDMGMASYDSKCLFPLGALYMSDDDECRGRYFYRDILDQQDIPHGHEYPVTADHQSFFEIGSGSIRVSDKRPKQDMQNMALQALKAADFTVKRITWVFGYLEPEMKYSKARILYTLAVSAGEQYVAHEIWIDFGACNMLSTSKFSEMTDCMTQIRVVQRCTKRRALKQRWILFCLCYKRWADAHFSKLPYSHILKFLFDHLPTIKRLPRSGRY